MLWKAVIGGEGRVASHIEDCQEEMTTKLWVGLSKGKLGASFISELLKCPCSHGLTSLWEERINAFLRNASDKDKKFSLTHDRGYIKWRCIPSKGTAHLGASVWCLLLGNKEDCHVCMHWGEAECCVCGYDEIGQHKP